MAQAQFLAISYKHRSFESVFSGSEINTFPYTLTKPEKQFVMAFKEHQLDEVLALIGMTRANITGQVDTERPNVKILVFNAPYEYSINYDNSVNQTIQNAVDKVFIDIYKKHSDKKFSVHFTNNAQSLGQKWEYEDKDELHIFLAAIGNSAGYEEVVHDNDLLPVNIMSNFMIPSYLDPSAVINMDGIPVAMIKGDKIIMMLYIAQYLNAGGISDEATARYASAMTFLYKSLDAVFMYVKENPDIFKKLIDLESEYKFMEFLGKLVTKRSEGHLKRSKEIMTLIPQVMTQLSDLTNEQEYLSRIVNALDPEGEKGRLLKEIGIIRKSQDVKDIVFEEEALIINMKHVMIPYQEQDKDKGKGKEQILHCGELTIILPFDSKKELLVLRSDFSKYPDKMKEVFKKLGCPHPNVFNAGRLCYGNTAETFATLRGLFDISSIFVMLNNFLHVYNPKSPTLDPELFPKTSVEEAMKLYNGMYPDDTITADLISYSDPVGDGSN